MNRTNNPNSMVPFNNVKIQLEQQMTVLNPTDQGLNQEHPQAASIAQLFNTFGSTTQTSSSDTYFSFLPIECRFISSEDMPFSS